MMQIELLDYRRKRLEEEPVLLETVLATSKGSGENFQSVDLLEYRRVVIQGKYDDSKSLFVGPRVQTLYGEAKKGYQMVTPFICQSQITEAWVLIPPLHSGTLCFCCDLHIDK